MKFCIHFLVFASLLGFAPVICEGCGVYLEDIPDPASESCVAFFRCYQRRQYSLRCPLGEAFHFDRARCRAETEVDCPLQLQRFQAPFVPHYLRPPQAPAEREVNIRVVHVTPNTVTSKPQSLNNRNNPAPGQIYSQPGQIVAAGQPLQPNVQQTFLYRTLDGRVVQSQGGQGPALQSRSGQTQYFNLPVQGQAAQSQNIPLPSVLTGQGQIVQDHNLPSQKNQIQTYQGYNTRLPQQNVQGQPGLNQSPQIPQQNYQGQTAQGRQIINQNLTPTQQTPETVQAQTVQGQIDPRQHFPPVQQYIPGQTVQGHQIPSHQINNQGQTVQGQQLSSKLTNQGQAVQGQELPSPQTNIQSPSIQDPKPTPQQQSIQDPQTQTQIPPTVPNQNVQYQIDQIHNLVTPPPQRGQDPHGDQPNISIFSPSSGQAPGGAR